jgi:CRISPR-associated protein Csd1
MILQALYEYYLRRPDLPAPGFEEKEIPFIIVLDEQGHLNQIQDKREGKKKIAKAELVPQAVKRSSGVAANLLWDNPGYVVGVDNKGDPARAAKQHEAFKQEIQTLGVEEEDIGVKAVLRFYDADGLASIFADPLWPEIEKTGANLSFRLVGRTELICQSSVVREALAKKSLRKEANQAICLITGETDAVERLHPSIKGVWGTQTTGGNIVSFNLDAFNSFGKGQGSNAQVGRRAAFAYTTALNSLLRRDSTQRIQVGDASTVFWAEKSNRLEDDFAFFFTEPPRDDPHRGTKAVESLFKAPQTGAADFDDDGTRFYVLGLAPNAARIAVRFWHVATVRELATHIKQHFRDLEIAHGPKDPPYLTIFRLLLGIAALGKVENIPPNLAGEFVRTILAGLPYPQAMLQAALRRINAEREITYPRTALVKAYLNRLKNEKEMTVALDETNTNIGYRLGRLFAVLEKIQEEANPGINTTIRERYYGAASSTPVAVFQTLMKLKNHHLAKLDIRGRAINFEKRITEIMDGVSDFPSILSLPDQGRFTIGYYHQRQDLFKKKEGDNA